MPPKSLQVIPFPLSVQADRALASLIGVVVGRLVAIAIGVSVAALHFRGQAQIEKWLRSDADEYYHRILSANRDLTAGLPDPLRAEGILDALSGIVQYSERRG